MKKQTLAALAAPMTILALSLSACGGSSAPAASSSTGAAAPSSSQSAGAPSTSESASGTTSTEATASVSESSTAVAGDDTLGDADVDAAAKVFKAKWSGSQVIGSKSGAYKMMAAAPALLEQADIKPAECKTLAVEAIKALPEDSKLSVVVNAQAPTTPGAVTTISFMSLANDAYFKAAATSAAQQAEKCKNMTVEMAGQKIESSTTTFKPEGVNAELVTGSITTQTIAGTASSTVSITASRGTVGVTAQATSDSAETRANLVKAVNEGFEALGAK